MMMPHLLLFQESLSHTAHIQKAFILCSPWHTDIRNGGLMAPYSIEELWRIISPIARQHDAESVSLFGSYSRGPASAESDVDLKIEKGQLHSLFQLCGFRLVVEGTLKLPVDLVTSESSDLISGYD